MRKLFYIFLFLLLTVPCFGANHYIRDGAGGSNDGTNWTHAWTTLPSPLTRGDTYYIADGNYANYTCNVTMWWWEKRKKQKIKAV